MGLEAAAAAVAGEEEDRVPAESGASLAAAATNVALAGSAGEGEAVGSKHSGRTLLLAIDLGLKMGASLFSSDGALIRYEYFALGSQDELLELAPRLLREWEADLPATDAGSISHVAIEGGDPPLWDAWESAVGGLRSTPPQLLSVSPHQWRAELLTPKERKSGFAAKEAARLIARQVVDDYGRMERHSGPFKTDAAEAVLVGLHVARGLGWVQRSQPVRRYSNGQPVVPKKSG